MNEIVTLEELEDSYIKSIFDKYDLPQKDIAKMLGVSPRCLRYKISNLRKKGIELRSNKVGAPNSEAKRGLFATNKERLRYADEVR